MALGFLVEHIHAMHESVPSQPSDQAKPPLPNFLVIGAARAGTTSLDRYLRQHPQIFMARKEPNFFAFEGEKLDFEGPALGVNDVSVTTIEEYRGLFANVTHEVAIGEASPIYLYWQSAPARIRRYVPGARLIAILRNPADRAYSKYLQYVSRGREPAVDFAEALRLEDQRRAARWSPFFSYSGMGFYYRQLRRYYDLFDAAQIGVWVYDDLQRDPQALLREIFGFLGVDETFVSDTLPRHNFSGVPRNTAARRLVRGVRSRLPRIERWLPAPMSEPVSRWLGARDPFTESLAPEIRRKLIEDFREDILQLEDLIGRDLSSWLT